MGVEAVGIYPNDQRQPLGQSLSITADDGTVSNLAFRFATQSNTWNTVNLWVTVDGVRRGGNEAVNGYANLGAAGFTGKARWSSTGNPVYKDGKYIYSIALSDSALSGVAALIKTLSYSASAENRTCDALRLTIEVRIVWGSGANDFVKGSATCYVGFKPKYEIDTETMHATYTTKGLEIPYAADGWSRPNDRYATGAISSAQKATVPSGTEGTASGVGKIVIPKSKLKRIPATGEALSGKIAMRGSWQGDSSSLGMLDVTGLTVANATELKTPTVTAAPYPESAPVGVLVTWTGVVAGSGQTAPTAVDVQLVGSDYAQDRATLRNVGDSHLFDALPCGETTSWQAVGYVADDDGYQPTPPVTVDGVAAVSFEGISIVPSDGSGAIGLPYDTVVTRDYTPEAETVKLAGRNRETVGFGEGGAASWTVSATAVTDEDPHLTGALSVTDIDALSKLPERGVCMIRTQNGKRAQVYVSKCNIGRPVGGNGVRTVSLTCEEVS